MLLKYILVLAVLLPSFALNAADTVLFDASKNSGVAAAEGGAVLKKTADSVEVVRGGKANAGGVAIGGDFDLSKVSAVRFYIESASKQPLPLRIVFQTDNPLWSEGKGFQSGTYVADGKNPVVVLVDADLGGEVYDLVNDPKKMRGNPFTMVSHKVDFSKIKKIRVYMSNPTIPADFAVKKIVAVSEIDVVRPAWFKYTKEQFFPFIDKYGQFIHKEWKDKIHSDADLQAELEKERKYLDTYKGASDRDKWGGWENGPKLAATGHFRIEKIDGKWWMVDPDGRLFWSHGAVRVTPSSGITPLDGRKFFFKDLPAKDDAFSQFYYTHDELLRPYYEKRAIKETYDFSAANICRKYGADWFEKYAEISHKRLRSWGLNTIANSSDKRIFMMDKTPYIDRFEIKSPELSGSEGFWWAFRDPFDPKFRENIRKNLDERKDELADPWCIGIFVDNELEWGNPDSHAVWTMMSPAERAAKKVFASVLKNKYGTIENMNAVWGSDYDSWDGFLKSVVKPPKGAYDDCVEFSHMLIEEYYKVIRSEIKTAAPHMLYMGCRFAGVPKRNPQAMYIGAKYCDVISYNIYCDVLDGLSLPAGIDKPIMIGEFHFGALDRGKFHTGLVRKGTQEERAQAYYNYVESALRHPNVIGTHWHQFSDQATTGRFDGENFQVGFTDICDTPYWETVDKVREIGYKMYKVRAGKEK